MSMTPGDPHVEITSLVKAVSAGDPDARAKLVSLMESDLKRLAQSIINAKGWPAAGLGGTELLSMAVVRFLGSERLELADRQHFFFLFGRVMHAVLVDEAKAAATAKRGGDRERVPMADFSIDGASHRVNVLDLHDALKEFRLLDPDSASVVELRFFGGRSVHQVAELMGCSYDVARGHWEYAKAWLRDRLADPIQ